MKILNFSVLIKSGCQKGFSIVSTLAAIGLTSIIVIAMSYMMQQGFSLQTKSSAQVDFDSLQFLLTYRLKSTDNLVRLLNLTQEQKVCFSRLGTDGKINCNDNNFIPQSKFNAWTPIDELTEEFMISGGIKVSQVVSWVADCTYGSCSKIEFWTQLTPYIKKDNSWIPLAQDDESPLRNLIKPKENYSYLPGYMFAPKEFLQFQCGQLNNGRKMYTGINFDTFKGVCEILQYFPNCESSRPLKGVTSAGTYRNIICEDPAVSAQSELGCDVGYTQISLVGEEVKCSKILENAVLLPTQQTTVQNNPTCPLNDIKKVCASSLANLKSSVQTLVDAGYHYKSMKFDTVANLLCREYICSDNSSAQETTNQQSACVDPYKVGSSYKYKSSAGDSSESAYIEFSSTERGLASLEDYLDVLEQSNSLKSSASHFKSFLKNQIDLHFGAPNNNSVGSYNQEDNNLKLDFQIQKQTLLGFDAKEGYVATAVLKIKNTNGLNLCLTAN